MPRTAQGPSSRQWKPHEEEIKTLYRTHPLEEVMKMMEEKGFIATRRMYQHQLKKWGVSKNMKKVEKDKRLEQIGQKERFATHDMTEERMDRKTWSKLRRRAREKQKEEMRKATGKPVFAQETEVPTPPTHSAGELISTQIYDQDDHEYEHATTNRGTAQPSTPEFSSDDEYLKVSRSSASSQNGVPLSSGTSPRQILSQIDRSARSSRSPAPLMRLEPQGCQIDLVIDSLQTLCRAQLPALGNVQMEARGEPSSSFSASQFWNNVKHGIYLLKVCSPGRAWPALNQAAQVPADAVVAQQLDFMRELFSTLSPTNTRISLQARTLLLRHLNRAGLPPSHPVTVITSQLLRDGHTQEFSRRALSCMLDMFTYSLGWANPLTLNIRRAIITMLRRASDCEVAGDMAKQLLYATEEEFGPGSPQARMAATELAHIHVDKGEYGAAAKLSMSVVAQSDSTLDVVGPRFHDARAVHAMEDLADIHAKMGEMEPSLVWLEKAAHDAWDLWEDNIATVHIFDKLDPLLRESGRSEDANWYKQRLVSVC